jgi:hypothetical protein
MSFKKKAVTTMPDKKLTDNLSNNSPILSNGLSDNEIVKALEWLKSKTKEYCEQCAYKNSEVCDICIFSKIEVALDLINRQDQENESLKAEIEKLKAKVNHYNYCYDNFVNTPISRIEAEALKEAASKFAGHSDYHGDTILCTLICMAEGKEVGNAKPLDKAEIKAEAYKECIERLKEHFTEEFCGQKYDLICGWFYNLLNELVGDA